MKSHKKRILITIDWFLPGYKAGGPIQSCANLIDHLKDEFEFWVITRDTDYCSGEPYDSVKSDAWNSVGDNVNVYYFSQDKLRVSVLHKLIKDVDADVIYINGIYSLYFSLLPLVSAYLLKINRVVVAGRGMLAAGSINVKRGKKKLFFQLANLLHLYKGAVFHATNEAEKQDILSVLGNKIPVVLAPNLPKKLDDTNTDTRAKEKGSLRLISVARISPEKNTRYALEILSRYKGTGKITFDLFGPIYNQEYWQDCLEVIKSMPPNVTVSYHGSIENRLVPDKLRVSHLLFMPTRGENFGHIILESLAAGCPVLISDKTPWVKLRESGVGFDIPLHLESQFLNAIEEVLAMNEEQFKMMSEKAKSFALEIINDSASVKANHAIFNT